MKNEIKIYDVSVNAAGRPAVWHYGFFEETARACVNPPAIDCVVYENSTGTRRFRFEKHTLEQRGHVQNVLLRFIAENNLSRID